MSSIIRIFLNAIPILVMIGLIPLIQNDYLLVIVYIVIIAISLLVRRERNDITVFIFGFFLMIASEYLFTSTGVETFIRNSLFGLMPIWLPFLWGYGFIAIKRSLVLLQ